MKGFNALSLAGLLVTAVAWLLATFLLSKHPDAAIGNYSWESSMFWGGDWLNPTNLLILKKVLAFGFGVQVLGVAILTVLPGGMTGILVAALGCLVTWPFGLIYLEGCLRAYNRDKYRCLEQFHPQEDEDETPIPGPFSALYTSSVPGILLMAFGAGFMYIDGLNCATLMFFFFGTTLLIRALRLQKQYVGLLHRDFITVRLNAWSPVYTIPNEIITDYRVDHRNMYLFLNADGKTVKIKVPVRCVASPFEIGFREHCEAKLAQLLPGKAPKNAG